MEANELTRRERVERCVQCAVRPTDRMCETCRHYTPHYMRRSGYVVPAHSGHCVNPRLKLRYGYDLCDNWSPMEDRRQKEENQ